MLFTYRESDLGLPLTAHPIIVFLLVSRKTVKIREFSRWWLYLTVYIPEHLEQRLATYSPRARSGPLPKVIQSAWNTALVAKPLPVYFTLDGA